MKKQNLFIDAQIGDLVDVFCGTAPRGIRKIRFINKKRQIEIDGFGYYWHTDGRSVAYPSNPNSQWSIKPHKEEEVKL